MKIKMIRGLEDITQYSYLYKRDVYRKGSNYYKFYKECCICGCSYFKRICYPSSWCSTQCAMQDHTIRLKLSKANLGKKHTYSHINNYKGGVVKKNLPLYDTYANKLSTVEEVKVFFDKQGLKLLKARCSKCNKWFVPKRSSCDNRVQFIVGNTDREGRFYCSDLCKATCSIYHKKKYPSGKNPRKHRNIVSESDLRVWSKEVLKRANHRCEYCDEKAVHAHHIQPKKLEPFYALDPDNGIACCEECHYKYGHVGDCSSISIANKKCTAI